MKLTNDEVKYRDGFPDHCCAACHLWLGRQSYERCSAVVGRIEANALCDKFERKSA